MHGEFPFPEATATTEVLIAGEGGGDQAKVLVSARLIGGLYDFCVGFWSLEEVVSTSVPLGRISAEKLKWVLNSISGRRDRSRYIIGLRYSAIIASGFIFTWWVIVPVVCTRRRTRQPNSGAQFS
jgi:uncharacterized oligopeptide transporter (OPT) family protein